MLTEGHAAFAAVAAAAEALPSKRQQRYNSKARKNTRNIEVCPQKDSKSFIMRDSYTF
jgi:hypothetical protein